MEGTWIAECVRGEPPAKLGAVNEKQTFIFSYFGVYLSQQLNYHPEQFTFR